MILCSTDIEPLLYRRITSAQHWQIAINTVIRTANYVNRSHVSVHTRLVGPAIRVRTWTQIHTRISFQPVLDSRLNRL